MVRIALADCVELAPDYVQAHAWLKEALERGDRWSTPRRVSPADPRPARPEGAERWDAWRAELVRRMAELDFKIKAERWGEDYAYYWFAQHARQADHPLAMDFTDTSKIYPGEGAGRAQVPEADEALALEHYEALIRKYPHTVFAEAAGLYRAVCRIKLGRSQEAERDLEGFLAAAPMGLYRGEAMWVLGDVALQERWDAKAAKKRYEQALDWCGRVRALKEGARLYAVPEKAAEPAKAPAAWQKMQPSGVIERERIEPGAVVNRLTAPWYLDRLEAELRYRLGFLESLAGDWEKAMEHWRLIADLDPLLAKAQRERYFNTLRRLEGCARKRHFIGDTEENARIPDNVRPAIWWADFLFMTERFAAADALFDRLYRTAVHRKDAVMGARAGMGRVFALSENANSPTTARVWLPKARAVGEEALGRFPRAPASAYLAFMIAHSWDSGAKFDYAEARNAYRRVYTDYPKSRHAEAARFYEIHKGAGIGDDAYFLSLIQLFREDYPNSRYMKAVDKLESIVQRRMNP